MSTPWPEYILVCETDSALVNERRSAGLVGQQSSHQKPALEFPPFFQEVLMHKTWDAGDPSGRIRITLSEQLVCKTNNSDETESGMMHDLICFSFQHAPRGMFSPGY